MLYQIKDNLRKIRCYHSANEIEMLLEYARENEISYVQFLDNLLNKEIEKREQTSVERNVKNAKFPVIKLIEEFDFNYQTTITKRKVQEWAEFDWLDKRENKIFMGPPGVGKTHLAIALGYRALHQNYKVRFYTMNQLMENMAFENMNNNFDNYLKKLMKNDLIIIDEIGYLPLKDEYSNLFFKLINECYEYRSLIITSNKLFNEWDRLLGNQTLATAILDRLLHHAEPVIINGDSYRLKNQKCNFDVKMENLNCLKNNVDVN